MWASPGMKVLRVAFPGVFLRIAAGYRLVKDYNGSDLTCQIIWETCLIRSNNHKSIHSEAFRKVSRESEFPPIEEVNASAHIIR